MMINDQNRIKRKKNHKNLIKIPEIEKEETKTLKRDQNRNLFDQGSNSIVIDRKQSKNDFLRKIYEKEIKSILKANMGYITKKNKEVYLN